MTKPATKTKAKGAAFGDLGDMMGFGGMSSVLSAVADAGRPLLAYIARTEILILAQQRNAAEMETEEQKLQDLADDMRIRGILQPLIVVKNPDGPEPWRLVAGERRFHASGLAEITEIPVMCYDELTPQQIKDIQLAENLHRLNLSQLNEAQVLKDRLDTEFGGDVEKLCQAISKSRAFVSKRLSLLDLPEQSQRLITEGVTADIEVINNLKTIEKLDPEVAKATVDQLKDEKGQKGANARKTVQAAKEQVKPGKKKQTAPAPLPTNPENVATERDDSHQQSGPVTNVPPETLADDPALQDLQEQFRQNAQDNDEPLPWEADDQGAQDDVPPSADDAPAQAPAKATPPALTPVQALNDAYAAIHGAGRSAKDVLAEMPEAQREDVKNWLNSFYDVGTECKNLAQTVYAGLQSGQFDTQGHGAYALVAFLSGGEEGVMFNLVNIMGTVKA